MSSKSLLRAAMGLTLVAIIGCETAPPPPPPPVTPGPNAGPNAGPPSGAAADAAKGKTR